MPIVVDSSLPARYTPVDPAPTDAGREPGEGLVPDHIRRLAWILDDAIPLFGKHRIGLDGFLSFIPVVGDAAGFGLAAMVVLSGVRAGCTWPTVVRMLVHALGESVAGMIPILGPVISFFWKANDRNLRIIESNLRDREATRRESWKVLLVGLGALIMLVGLVVVATAVAVYAIWNRLR